ncbi:hypothetical protein ON010_g18838 [Phytophthora cinnamomi]|nr:hypothetical protein ON010_g18838 [Phytophthora cinnamomi]
MLGVKWRGPAKMLTFLSVMYVTGFLREQLKLSNLTPLRRWYLQLQLLVAEDCKTPQVGDDIDSALQACVRALGQDKSCFDVVYRQGARVADAREALLDESAPMDVRELLSFSTRSNGFICRVTYVNDGKQIAVNCSEWIDNLQTHLQLLVSQEATPVSAAISFIHNALQQH